MCGESRHAQVVMKDLGIIYSHSTPQSIADQWWFWNCINLPENLPTFLKVMNINAKDCIGYGISKEECDEIERKQQNE